jgi:hypothetical protein
MPTVRVPTVRRALPAALLLLVVACDPTPRPGTQIGALRKPDPSPMPPSDLAQLDLTAAVDEALRVGGLTTLASAWVGHVATLEAATPACPGVWIGPLPEDLVDADMGDDPGLSWVARCTTDPDLRSFDGFSHWSASVVEDTSGQRTLIADASVTDDADRTLFAFDGEASDSLEIDAGGWSYGSDLDGTLTGSLTGAGGGFRTGGGFEASWSSTGGLRMFGTVTALEGFGPPDQRAEDAPEVAELPGWSSGQPRFTSIRFDLEIEEACPEEPIGYVGIRGNEGFWFDVYFLPKFAPEDDTFEAVGFPYEQIDNIACDGIGTLFARNIDLRTIDDENGSWSREVAPDFAAAIGSLQAPALADFVYTLRNLPQE